MADVLIRGLEMPKCCALCDLEHWDEDSFGEEMNHRCAIFYKGYTAKVRETGRLPGCPLVPLPKGHGRLIDADELIKAKSVNNIAIMIDIADAPTIVPAEGGGAQ